MRLSSLDSEILVCARQLLDTAVKEDEVVHQLDKPLFRAHQQQVLVQLEAPVVVFVLLPLEEVLFWGSDGAVLQSLRIVAGEHKLHSAEEPGIELRLLIREALADAVANAHAAVL